MDGPPGFTYGPSQKKKGTEMLLAVVVVLVLVIAVVYAVYARQGGGGGGGSGATPCKSPKMPALAPGVTCGPAGGGQYAWLSAHTPATAGIAPPAGGAKAQTHTATDAKCVTESSCQAICAGSQCSFYTYDYSAQAPTRHCPNTGSVCTTYTGALPATVTLGTTPYVTGGIPAAALA